MKSNQHKTKSSSSSSNNRNYNSSNNSTRNNTNRSHNKRHLSADGLSLLPSALRPRLLGGWSMLSIHFRGSKNCVSMILAVLSSSFICLGMNSSNVFATSMTLTILSSPITLSLSPSSSASGTFAKSGSIVSVKSDAYFGYTLTIKGKSSDNSLVNGSNKIQSIASSITESEFKTNADYNNKWGYAPSKLNSSNNTDFIAGPTNTTTNTIDKTTSANANAANNYTLTIAAKVDNAVPNGKYSNNITISATANSVPYSITYDLQEGTNAPTPNPQTGTTTESSVKLSPTVPTKENYEFLGWCTVVPVDNGTAEPNCIGTTYQPNADYPSINSTNTVTLYAIWKQPTPSLMNFDCSSLSDGWSINTTDNILIRKVGEQCWMWTDYITNVDWTTANSSCPTGWHLPSQSEFQTLISNFGYKNQLYNAGWSGRYYWSSTVHSVYTTFAAYLDVNGSDASTVYGVHGTNDIGNKHNVRCVAS